MIKEVLVVEGRSDVARIQASHIDVDMITTDGFSLRKDTLEHIQRAYEKRGIIILTDPDSAGERIRMYLSKRFPKAKHAFVSREEATANGDIGIEQAAAESIKSALLKTRYQQYTPTSTFTMADLWSAQCSGCDNASVRRSKIGAILGIGYGNAKQFLQRLNHYGVTREEWKQAVAQIGD